ncbi:MAG: hypothetical protein AAGD04_00690 [Pseudomonadota bacterium]
MSIMEEVADQLAQDVIAAAEEIGNDNLIEDVSKSLAATSTTTQEAFLTAVRYRQAEKRARRLLKTKVASESW